MPIEKVSTILKDADANNYGAAAFNVFNYETIHWAIQAAQEERIPVIIQFYPGFNKYIPMEVVAAITKELAAKVSIPIGLHLDHSTSFEEAVSGILSGFPSVMIDGSSLSFSQNTELTSKVVQAAHAAGVEVEAELGHVGLGSNAEDFTNSSNFTDPEKVYEFIGQTEADSLAISVGNGHGQYVSAPSLDFKRIRQINKIVATPLVMHGGSDIPDDQLQKSIICGMNKFNIATEYDRTFYFMVSKYINDSSAKGYMFKCLNQAKDQIIEFLRVKLRTLNPKSYKV